ncbi:unnamed protein product [Paramecium pentaurelia]|uniref:Uncharacterized protein n=1 Tax=Paramecium pentaurelia TaxID=43138 RepID=A0A8S1WE05_9CILI|nr:unnamed protein product [Paramecium pentaurelia]
MHNLMNCYQHNSKTTHICNKLDCKYKLACNSCVNQQHIGHVDTNVTPISKFVDRILYEFQRSEVERLKRIYYKEDIIQHIKKEFQYLKEKTNQILNQREQKLISLIDNQWIHSKQLKNIIDHIEMMKDGKVYEEGLQLVLPILQQGSQDVINKYEKDKIRIVTKVREQINQVKTVLDGLFYIGNQYQLDQQQIKLENALKLENSLKQSEDRLFQSAIQLSNPKEYHTSKPYGTYQEFVDSLYPDKQQEYIQSIDYTSLLARPTKFDNTQLQFEKTENFQLYGVIDHLNYVISCIRMKNGQIVTCSTIVSFFEYPSLKLMQQLGNNQNIKQVVEITQNLIALLTQTQVLMYEKRKDKWIPKGEFITPNIGVINKIGLINDLFLILVQTQLIVYKLKQQIIADQPIEYLFINLTPQIYMHKYDCCSFAIFENKLFSADLGGRLYQWKLGNVFHVDNVIQSSNNEIIGIIPMHDSRIITIGTDGVIRLWDNALQLVTTIKHRSSFTASVEGKELDTFYTGDVSGKIQKWKVTVLIESLIELDAHNDQITDLQFNQYLISCSADKKVKIWITSK